MSKAEGFAAVPNWMIRDESFDIYDIAVYAALASHTGPGGVRPSQTTVAAEARCSERKVRSTLQHLADRGVVQVVRRRRRGAGAGRHGALTDGYVLMPHGALSDDDEFVSAEEPAPDAGTSVTNRHTTTDQPAHESKALLSIEEEPIEEEPVYMPTFDEFWAVWPRKDSKKTAQAAWARAVKRADPDVILAAATAYTTSPYRPERQFVPYGATWLNGDRWTDPAPEPAATGADRPGPNDRLRAGIEMGARLQAEFDARGRGCPHERA